MSKEKDVLQKLRFVSKNFIINFCKNCALHIFLDLLYNIFLDHSWDFCLSCVEVVINCKQGDSKGTIIYIIVKMKKILNLIG